MKEMRIKDEYLHHKEIWGANGVKVAAPGLDNAVAGTPLIVANNEDDLEDAKAIVLNEFENIKKKIKL
jgi:translation initiation factor 5B